MSIKKGCFAERHGAVSQPGYVTAVSDTFGLASRVDSQHTRDLGEARGDGRHGVQRGGGHIVRQDGRCLDRCRRRDGGRRDLQTRATLPVWIQLDLVLYRLLHTRKKTHKKHIFFSDHDYISAAQKPQSGSGS
jgi:hypothetical protein